MLALVREGQNSYPIIEWSENKHLGAIPVDKPREKMILKIVKAQKFIIKLYELDVVRLESYFNFRGFIYIENLISENRWLAVRTCNDALIFILICFDVGDVAYA